MPSSLLCSDNRVQFSSVLLAGAAWRPLVITERPVATRCSWERASPAAGRAARNGRASACAAGVPSSASSAASLRKVKFTGLTQTLGQL